MIPLEPKNRMTRFGLAANKFMKRLEQENKMTTRLIFDEARKAYGGSKNGLENELANFIYRSKNPLRGQPKYNPDEVVDLLLPAIEAQKAERVQLIRNEEFVPAWPMMGTWINQQRWSQECRVKKTSEQRSQSIDRNNMNTYRKLYSETISKMNIDALRVFKMNKPHLRKLIEQLRPEILK